MTTLLLLCSLLLAALGLTAGAFALHAYVGDNLGDRGPITPVHAAAAAPLLMRPRAHFVVLDPPAHPGDPHTAAAMAKPKAKGHEKPAGADARHAQKAATPAASWPWSLFQ
jgi:hypothetical protein